MHRITGSLDPARHASAGHAENESGRASGPPRPDGGTRLDADWVREAVLQASSLSNRGGGNAERSEVRAVGSVAQRRTKTRLFRLTYKVGRVIGAAASFIRSDLRVRAQGARAILLVVCIAGRDD